MNLVLAIMIGFLFACGVYGLLRRSLIRLALGVVLISHAANLLVFSAGKLIRGKPAVIEGSEKALAHATSDPLPQALVLTAIVIGFGLISFLLALIMQAHRNVGSDDIDQYRGYEE